MTLAIREPESDYHKYHDKNYHNYHYIHYSSISIILKRSSAHLCARVHVLLASLSGRARIQRSCSAPMRPAGSGAGGCNPADPVAGEQACSETGVQRCAAMMVGTLIATIVAQAISR